MDKSTELMISVITHFTIRRRPYLSSCPSQYSNGIMDWTLYLQILLVPGMCSTQSIWWPFGDLCTFYSLLLTCCSIQGSSTDKWLGPQHLPIQILSPSTSGSSLCTQLWPIGVPYHSSPKKCMMENPIAAVSWWVVGLRVSGINL